jgi:acetylserotonin N-methyltransferase
MPKDFTIPDPAPILDLLEGFRRSKTMFAAVALGVFDTLTAGPKSLSELTSALGANSDGLERLLDACVGLELLTKQGDRYANSPVAATYLTATSPRRFTGYINFSNEILWKLWANLEDAVREGKNRWKQTYGFEGDLFAHFFHDDRSKREFLLGMHGYGVISSPRVVSAFDLTRFQRFVDLGGATGHLAIAACERYPHMHAILFDLPVALPLAGEIIGASGYAERIERVGGDFFNDPLPPGDLYALGRILHDWPEDKILHLLRRIHEHLPTGGGVLIAERLVFDDKKGPRSSQMQDLNMLVCTEGKERTLGEYDALLQRVGFGEVQGCRTGSTLDAMLAIKG